MKSTPKTTRKNKHDPKAAAIAKQHTQLARQISQNPALAAPYQASSETQEAEKLKFWYAAQGVHPHYPLADWKYEVANNDTKRGYWEWVANQIENKVPVKIPITIPTRRR